MDHIDVAAYAAGFLGEPDRAAFERHLAGCEACRGELQELASMSAVLRTAAPPLPPLPLGVEARTVLAVERAAAAAADQPRRDARRATPRRRSWFSMPRLVPAVGFACLALGFAGGALVNRDGDGVPLEVVATLDGRAGASAGVEVVKTGIGRVVRFDTDDLPILPTGEYYELWWVGPKDRPGRPDRISAGTFHPDEQGVSQVTFAAAVDPAKYPRLAVTAEPGDGDPRPAGRDVMRGAVRPPA